MSTARYRACRGVLFSAVGSEGVILSVDESAYYGLDEVGVVIWNALADGKNLTDVHQSLLADYDVDADRLAADIDALVTNLVGAHLLEPIS